MTQQQEAMTLAEALMADVELDETTTAKRVLKAQRLARLTKNESAQEWLDFEIHGVTAAAAGRAWMTLTRRWTDPDQSKGYWAPAADLQATKDAAEASLAALSGNLSLSGDMVALASRERTNAIQVQAALAANMSKVLASIDAQIYRLAADTYGELKFSEIQATLFESSREKIDAVLAGTAGDSLKKVESINERLGNDGGEAISQAMTTCRRLIDAVADHVFPSSDDPYVIGQQELSVKQGNVLNRINAFVHTRGVQGSRADRLRRALSDLYGRVSTGVHSDVDPHEARFIFLATYTTLGEVLTLGS